MSQWKHQVQINLERSQQVRKFHFEMQNANSGSQILQPDVHSGQWNDLVNILNKEKAKKVQFKCSTEAPKNEGTIAQVHLPMPLVVLPSRTLFIGY